VLRPGKVVKLPFTSLEERPVRKHVLLEAAPAGADLVAPSASARCSSRYDRRAAGGKSIATDLLQ